MKRTRIFVFVYALIGILAVSCNSRTSTQETQRAIDPDKFALALIDKSTNKNNFLEIKITPGSPSMRVEDFEVKGATIADDPPAIVCVNNINIAGGINVAALKYRRLKANHDSQGMPIVFRVRAIPNTSVRKGDSYTITMEVVYNGNNRHIERKSLVLTAKHDGYVYVQPQD